MDADAFRDNATLVHEAAKRGHLETLEVLVEHGAMVNGVDVSGNTPLHYAAFHKHMDSVIFLVQMGCPLNLINKDGWTAFANAITAGHLGIVRYLHRQGAILQPGGSNHPALTSCLEVQFWAFLIMRHILLIGVKSIASRRATTKLSNICWIFQCQKISRLFRCLLRCIMQPNEVT